MDAATAFPKPSLPGSCETSRSGLLLSELLRLVQTTERQLRKLSGASILITGATGWFGIWLLEALCAADDSLQLGIRITAVSRRPDAGTHRLKRADCLKR
jgi:hypothetical protein